MIEGNFKGFYFFDWEIELLKEIGFQFPKLKKTNELKDGRGNSSCTYRILENPHPIKLNSKRRKLLEELPYKMNAINVSIASHPKKTRNIEYS